MRKSALALLLFSINVHAACPNFTGDWQCEDTTGDKWTESIHTEGNRYAIITNAMTPDADTQLIIADGRKITEKQSLTQQAQSTYNTVIVKVINTLPEFMQLTALDLLVSDSQFNIDTFNITGNYKCPTGKLVGTFNYDGEMSLAPILNSTVKGVMTTTLNAPKKGVRTGVIAMNGSFEASSKINILQPIETKEKYTDKYTFKCSKIKL